MISLSEIPTSLTTLMIISSSASCSLCLLIIFWKGLKFIIRESYLKGPYPRD